MLYLTILNIIGITITNNIVLVITTFVAYFTSPLASWTNIGRTANTGAAVCIIYVCLSNCVKSPEITVLKSINPIITTGENINLKNNAKIVSLSKCILCNPASAKTIPIYISDNGVTILPKYPNVAHINSGVSILTNKTIKAIINAINGGDINFFQLKCPFSIALSFT